MITDPVAYQGDRPIIAFTRRIMCGEALGRWLTRDPLGYADGMNVYQYLRGRVLDLLDPTGLLSEEDIAGIIYAETSSLRPAWKDPNGPQKYENYDPESVRQLHEARRHIAETAKCRDGKGVEPPKIPTEEELQNENVRRAWEDAKNAAANPTATGCECKHFVIWPSEDGKVPTDDPKMEGDWPYTEENKNKIEYVYGPFRNPKKVGDVPAGDNIYIFVYCKVK